MSRRTIYPLACMILCAISTPSQSAEIIGAWKIDTSGGPTPLCSFVQAGDDLSGVCVGPQAKGKVAGTVSGSTVRWRWQWVTNSGDRSGAFDFVGTLVADNTITGTVELREVGLALNFTAKKQIETSTETSLQPTPREQRASTKIPRAEVPIHETILSDGTRRYSIPIRIGNSAPIEAMFGYGFNGITHFTRSSFALELRGNISRK